VNVRIVAATNADLEAMMSAGKFREDLYDRLAFQTIHTPPLRSHTEDIPELATHFLTRFREEVPSVSAGEFSGGALEKLAAYPWPGNVRELKNVVERAATLATGDSIDADQIELSRSARSAASGGFTEQVQEFERSLILDALERADYSQTKAAKLLDMSYDQFRHYYRKYREE
jgi:DNA-binding NtrC family response regulator